MTPSRLCSITWATRAASTQAATSSQHSGSSSSMPVTWWNGILARLKTLAISGTGQAEQIGQPLAGHLRPVAQAVERLVVDGRARAGG